MLEFTGFLITYTSIALLVWVWLMSPIPYAVQVKLKDKGFPERIYSVITCDKCNAFWAGAIYTMTDFNMWIEIPIFGGLTIVLVKLLFRYT